MASPMQLVESVASALGVDLSTVVTHDRNLVAAGLRTKGGRGPSAARMTAQDATNLLIAVAGAEQVRESVRAVESFTGLKEIASRSPIPDLSAGHTYGEALAAFIQAFVDDGFRYADQVTLTFEMTRPQLRAEITGIIHDHEIKAVYRTPAHRERAPPGDLVTVTRFTQATLGLVGLVLRN